MTVRILTRQSSYWDLVTPTGEVRIHFLGKKEHRFVEAECDGFVIHSAHPVLIQYQQVWRAIYIGSRVPNPRDILEKIAGLILKEVAPWRTSAEFLHTGIDPLTVLSSGSGLLLRAPKLLAEPIEALLKAEGISFSNLAEHTPKEPMKVLIAGRNFVVARDFRAEGTQQGVPADRTRPAGSSGR